MDRGWAGGAGLPLIGSFFLTGGESNRRASDKGWESERPNAETRGGRREGGRRGERGMKSAEGGGKAAQRSPSCGAIGALPRAGAQQTPRPGSRPGPARWGPQPAEAAGRGRGRSTWGATQPGARESTAPGSATSAARRREPSAASGSRQRRPRCSPGLGDSANIIQTSQTFLLSPLFGVSFGWNCSSDSRGALGRNSSPGFLGGWANFAGPWPRGSHPSAELSPRCSPAQEGCFASGRAPSPSPLHSPQAWRQRINQRGAGASRHLLPLRSEEGRPLGRKTSLSVVGGLLD